MATRPSDQDILDAIGTPGSRALTALVWDRLRRKHGDVPIAWVRGRLLRLEADGHVMRMSTSYKTQICWGVSTHAISAAQGTK